MQAKVNNVRILWYKTLKQRCAVNSITSRDTIFLLYMYKTLETQCRFQFVSIAANDKTQSSDPNWFIFLTRKSRRKRQDMDETTIDSIFSGSLKSLPPVSSKIVRIFTSSTFTGKLLIIITKSERAMENIIWC